MDVVAINTSILNSNFSFLNTQRDDIKKLYCIKIWKTSEFALIILIAVIIKSK